MSEETSLVDRFVETVKAANPLHSTHADNALSLLDDARFNEFNDYLRYCLDTGLTLEYVADSYNTIVNDTRDEQIHFMRNQAYRFHRFEDVAKSVYFNNDYMGKYMYGLAITAFMWPNHVVIRNFFVSTLPKNLPGEYLEIGPGHGLYFLKAMRVSAYDRFTGIDISPTSIEITRRAWRYFFPESTSEVVLQVADFLDIDDPRDTFDAIVMGEVLEHVETPAAFLRQIAAFSSPETHIFVTTCVNTPAIDHIYLFRAIEEVEDMIVSQGLSIKERLYVPYTGKTLDECKELRLSINLAYVLGADG